jgi:hypothetical protein
MEDANDTLLDFESAVALTSKIFEDQLRMRTVGIDVRGWTPNRETGVVQLRVGSDQAHAQAWVDQTYGAGRVNVVRVGRPPASNTPY